MPVVAHSPFIVLKSPRPQLGESRECVVHILLVRLEEGQREGGQVGFVEYASEGELSPLQTQSRCD